MMNFFIIVKLVIDHYTYKEKYFFTQIIDQVEDGQLLVHYRGQNDFVFLYYKQQYQGSIPLTKNQEVSRQINNYK